MENEKIICVDCQEEFEITEGWKRLMEKNPEILPPKRCYKMQATKKVRGGKVNKIELDEIQN